MNAILYARFSPRPNADKCVSVDDQLYRMYSFCEKNKHHIAGEFYDKDASGADWEREGIRDAITKIKRGYILVVESLSRLSRDIILQETYMDQVRKRGGSVVSLAGEGSEGLTLDDQLIRKIIGTLNEYQRKVQAQLTSKRMIAKQSQGKMVTRPDRLPYGYRMASGTPGKKDCLIEPDKREQAIIERVKAMRGDNESYLCIANTLNSEGIPTKSGKKWHSGTVFNILKKTA